MPRPSFGPNVTIFILFFGVALVDAIRHGEWLLSALYLVLAMMFVFARPFQGDPHAVHHGD